MAINIWIINPYGNLPGENWREYRSTLLANALVSRGHKVTWWTSNFDHRSKRFRCRDWKDISIDENFVVRLVPTKGYSSNVSLARIRNERCFGRQVYAKASSEKLPDVMVLAEPALFFGQLIMQLARNNNIKLVVDVLDLWPELFDILLPTKVRLLGRIIFYPLYKRRAKLLEAADAVVAVSEDYLRAVNAKQIYREVIYLGIEHKDADSKAEDSKNDLKKNGEIWAIYAGTLGVNYDIKTILEAAATLMKCAPKVKIIIAGNGPMERYIKSTIMEKQLKNVKYLGYIKLRALEALYKKCDIALATYKEKSTVSMPVKIFDYCAAGIPVVNSLSRELKRIVQKCEIGVQYKPGDPDSLASAIRLLSVNNDMRRHMGANAKKLAEEFSSSKQYGKYVELIEKIAT